MAALQIASLFQLLFALFHLIFLPIQPKSVTGILIGWEQSRGSTWRQRSQKRIRRRNMPQRFSKRGSGICTGSAKVTEGCHVHFAEYATSILALLQEGGMGQGKTSTGSHRFATLCAVVLPLLSLPNSNEKY